MVERVREGDDGESVRGGGSGAGDNEEGCECDKF